MNPDLLNRSIYSDQALADMALVKTVLIGCRMDEVFEPEKIAERIVIEQFRQGRLS